MVVRPWFSGPWFSVVFPSVTTDYGTAGKEFCVELHDGPHDASDYSFVWKVNGVVRDLETGAYFDLVWDENEDVTSVSVELTDTTTWIHPDNENKLRASDVVQIADFRKESVSWVVNRTEP